MVFRLPGSDAVVSALRHRIDAALADLAARVQDRSHASSPMKRRLNTRLILWLLVPTVCSSAGAYGIYRLQVRRNAGALLEKAHRAMAKGDLAKSEESLRLYLGYKPDHPSALASYGLVLSKLAQTQDERQKAFKVCERALGLDPSQHDVRRRAADLAMSLGMFTAARNHLTTLLGRSEPGRAEKGRIVSPEESALEYLIAYCSEGALDFAAAARWYQDATAHDPAHIDGYVRLAWLLRGRLDDASGADRIMDARVVKDGMIAANPQSPRARLERAFYRKKYHLPGIDEDVARALELNPDEAGVLLASALWAIEKRDFDAARRHLSHGLKDDPKNWQMSDALSWVERETGRVEEAKTCLQRGIDASVDPHGRNELFWAFADLLIDQHGWAEANRVIDSMEQRNVPPEPLQYLRARIKAGEGKWIEAANELETIYPGLLRQHALAYQADILLAECYRQAGAVDRRHSACRRAIDLDPQALPARLALAQALEAMGRPDEALVRYRELVEPVPSARVDVARLLVKINLRRPASQRDWREVERALDQASEAMADSSELVILRAESQTAQGHPAHARDLLRQSRDRYPDRVEFWTALAELANRQETPEAAMSVIEEAQRRLGDRVDLRLARLLALIKRGGAGASHALDELERNLEAFTPSDQWRLLKGLADAHFQIGDRAGADRLVNQLTLLRPFDLGVRMTQFELAYRLGDESRMASAIREIERIESRLQSGRASGGAFWRCCKARLCIWQAGRGVPGASSREQLTEARLLLTEVDLSSGSWPIVVLSQAELDDLLGDMEAAIKGYLRALELGVDNRRVLHRVAQMLYARGRFSQANEAILRWQEQVKGADDRELQRLAAQVAIRVNDRERAFSLVRQSIPANSTDYRDHLWAGQIFWAGGEPLKAEPELRRAVELGGESPDVWVTLVEFLARTGQPDKARTLIEQARGRLPTDRAGAALARCFTALGDADRAHAEYQTALAARPADIALLRGAADLALATGRVREAEADLLRITDQEKVAPAQAAWARRTLAVILASTKNPRQSLRALKLMGLDLDGLSYEPSAGEPIEELRAKAEVLALQPNRAARRAAIGILEQVLDREPGASPNRDLLAQLYDQDGNWRKARSELRTLLAAEPDNPSYIAHAVRALLRHGVNDEAELWLAKLEKLRPLAGETFELRARMLQSSGKSKEAVFLLLGWIKERPNQALNTALLLEQLGEVAAAEGVYRAHAAQSRTPQAALALAGFLARRNQLAEALDLCETAWGPCPPQTVAEAMVTMLYATTIDDAQCRRAALLLEKELQKNPKAAPLLFHLANVRSLQGDYEQAQHLYQESIEYDQTNSGPLINLAWLIARKDGAGTRALELLSRAISLDGPNPDFLDTQALAYLAAGQNDLAIKNLDDALGVSPSPLKYVHLAQAYLAAQRRSDAEVALRNAQTAGLDIKKLNPLERESCVRLLEALAHP
jgi:tetratricopeptide (TPR) repeat protein